MRRVVVTGVLGRCGLEAVRQLGRAGYRVSGADARPALLDLHSRYSDPYVQLPGQEDPRHGPALLDLCRTVRADALLAAGTWTVGAIAAMRDRFDAVTAVNVPTAAAFALAVDKRRTMEECASLGIPVPRTGVDTGEGVVVKPALDAGGARGLAFCTTASDVEAASTACREGWGEPLVQEYIPGDAGAMRTVVVLFDRASRLVARLTMRKVRTYPARGGLTALGVSTDEPALVDLVLPLFRRWRWQGPAEVELKIDPRDGIPKVIEVNPRFPGYYPFAAACGLPLAQLAVQAALGEAPSSPPPYRAGVRYVNPGLWLKAVAGDVLRGPNRSGALRRARAELREGRAPEGSWRTPDPWPRLGKILQESRDALFGRPA